MNNFSPQSPNRGWESGGSDSPASSSGGSSPNSPYQSHGPIRYNDQAPEGWPNPWAAPSQPQFVGDEPKHYPYVQQHPPSSKTFGHMPVQNLNLNNEYNFQYGQNYYPNNQPDYSNPQRNFQSNQRVHLPHANDKYHHPAVYPGQWNFGPSEKQPKYSRSMHHRARPDCNDQGSRRNSKPPPSNTTPHHTYQSKSATMNHVKSHYENHVAQRPGNLKHHHQESSEDIQNRSLDPKRQRRTVSPQERPSSSSSAESSEAAGVKHLSVTFQEMSINCNRDPVLPPPASYNPSPLVIPPRARPGPKNAVKEIQIFANHFRIPLPKDLPTVFVYTFKVESEYQRIVSKIPLNVRRAILTQLLLQLDRKCPINDYGIFTDYSQHIYSLKELPSMEQYGQIEGKDLTDLAEEHRSKFLVPIAYKNTRSAGGGDPQWGSLADKEWFYNTLLSCVMHKHFTKLGKGFVCSQSGSPLDGNIYQGINASFRCWEENRVFLNIDVNKRRVDSGGKVLEVLAHHLKGYWKVTCNTEKRIDDVTTWSDEDRDVASKFLQNLQITYPVSRDGIKVYRKVVRKVHPQPASKTFLENYPNMEDPPISLEEYYTSRRNIRLQYPQGPVLECNSGKIPAELCTIKPAQLCPQFENNRLKLQLSPEMRYEAIEKAQRTIAGTELFEANINMPAVSKEAINSRVLAPPMLAYGQRLNDPEPELNKIAVIKPQDGTWDVWATNDKEKFAFHQPAQVHSWAILNLTSINAKKLTNFAEKLIEKASTKNMTFPHIVSPTHIVSMELKPESENISNVELLEREFRKLKKTLSQEDTVDQKLAEFEKMKDPSIAPSEREKKLAELTSFLKMQHTTPRSSIILVVIPKKGSLYYNQVKQAAELKVGVLTQCIVQTNVENPQKWDKVLGNLLLEMNAKLGSVNHLVVESPECPGSFGLLDAPVMILGADVSHPPPGSSRLWNGKDVGPPSYVGVTASLDRTGMPYMMHVEAQKREGKGAAEVIQNMEGIVKKFISHFQKRAEMFPSKIVYFRDGVSDSQFHEVLDKEMLAIRKACTSYGEGLKPQITFVVVQKRHRTRFFTPDTKPGKQGELTNPRSGTVVDEDIVSSGTTDFYLISHKGELGTSRPTRYQVLWDDSGLSMNEIETLAYYLCFMYSRCNRAVKVPAPTYYAHWAAKRAEALCQGWGHEHYANLPELNNLLRKREELDCAKEYPMHFI